VKFGPARGSEDRLHILPQPGVRGDLFAQPGDFTVMSSLGGAQLELVVLDDDAHDLPEVKIDIHQIGRLLPGSIEADGAQLASAGQTIRLSERQGSSRRDGASSGDVEFKLIGHLAYLGDVVVDHGAWLAGPAAPAPIEGLCFRTDTATENWFELQTLVKGQRDWSAWRPATDFAGTKGRGLPLLGVRCRVTSQAPADIELEASALFLGAPVVHQRGRTVEFVSMGGHDPLIGLNFKATLRPVADRSPVASPVAATRSERRVRVFRAGVEQPLLNSHAG
jgi:hypothetical protein